jgi:hypothetical protein
LPAIQLRLCTKEQPDGWDRLPGRCGQREAQVLSRAEADGLIVRVIGRLEDSASASAIPAKAPGS